VCLLKTLLDKRVKIYIEKVKNANLNDVYKTIIGTTEKAVIEEILSICNYNQIKASRLLGINRNTLRKKIKIHKISLKNHE